MGSDKVSNIGAVPIARDRKIVSFTKSTKTLGEIYAEIIGSSRSGGQPDFAMLCTTGPLLPQRACPVVASAAEPSSRTFPYRPPNQRGAEASRGVRGDFAVRLRPRTGVLTSGACAAFSRPWRLSNVQATGAPFAGRAGGRARPWMPRRRGAT